MYIDLVVSTGCPGREVNVTCVDRVSQHRPHLSRPACRILTSSRSTRQHPAASERGVGLQLCHPVRQRATCARTAIQIRVRGQGAHEGGTYCTSISGHDVSARANASGDMLCSLRTGPAPRCSLPACFDVGADRPWGCMSMRSQDNLYPIISLSRTECAFDHAARSEPHSITRVGCPHRASSVGMSLQSELDSARRCFRVRL